MTNTYLKYSKEAQEEFGYPPYYSVNATFGSREFPMILSLRAEKVWVESDKRILIKDTISKDLFSELSEEELKEFTWAKLAATPYKPDRLVKTRQWLKLNFTG